MDSLRIPYVVSAPVAYLAGLGSRKCPYGQAQSRHTRNDRARASFRSRERGNTNEKITRCEKVTQVHESISAVE